MDTGPRPLENRSPATPPGNSESLHQRRQHLMDAAQKLQIHTHDDGDPHVRALRLSRIIEGLIAGQVTVPEARSALEALRTSGEPVPSTLTGLLAALRAEATAAGNSLTAYQTALNERRLRRPLRGYVEASFRQRIHDLLLALEGFHRDVGRRGLIEHWSCATLLEPLP